MSNVKKNEAKAAERRAIKKQERREGERQLQAELEEIDVWYFGLREPEPMLTGNGFVG